MYSFRFLPTWVATRIVLCMATWAVASLNLGTYYRVMELYGRYLPRYNRGQAAARVMDAPAHCSDGGTNSTWDLFTSHWAGSAGNFTMGSSS